MKKVIFAYLKKLRRWVMEHLPIRQVCPYPFSRISLGDVPGFVPCCVSFLKPELFALPLGDDPWNGPQAQALRAQMYRRDYRYCDTQRCGTELISRFELKYFPKLYRDAIVSPQNLKAMRQGRPDLPDGPSTVALNLDTRCNLACPSCRNTKISRLSPAEEQEMQRVEKWIETNRENLEVITLSTRGEALFSSTLRKWIKTFDHQRFPKLRSIALKTNGLLMDERNFHQLKPGSDLIRTVSISIDASDAEMYQKIRGGDWHKLWENVDWVMKKRRQGRFDWVGLNFVFQKANYSQMEKFVSLGHEYGVDGIRFQSLLDESAIWGLGDYKDEAVHLTDHPEHPHFLKIYESVKHDPLVRFEL